MADREKTETRRTHPKPEKAERVRRIVELMGTDRWEPGITAPALAAEWGVELVTVEQLAVEAKRTVGVVGEALAAVEADGDEREADLAATMVELRGTVVAIGDAVVSLGKRIEDLEVKRGNRPGALELALRKMARPETRPAVPEMPEGEEHVSELAPVTEASLGVTRRRARGWARRRLSSAKRQEETASHRGGRLRVSFIKFAKWCKVKLEPGQVVYGKVALDGVQPKDLVGEERELARQLFGDVETISDRKRKTIAAVCGARGGKSYVMGALTMLWLALTVDVSKVAPGQVAGALILAPDIELATEQLNYVKGLVEAAGLSGTVVKQNETRVRFRRGDGKLVEVVVRAIGKGGTGGRGRTLVGCCIDEANFLNTEGFAVNDADAYKAAKIRIIPGGVMVICSTPWVRAGKLYEFHRDNHGKDTETCLSVHAPTIALRVDPDILEMVEEAYEHDPDNAAREFGAVFPESSASRFFSEGQLERASANDHVMPRAPRPGATLTAAGDLAFVRNSATLVIAAHYPKVVTTRADGTEVVISQPYVELVDVLELRPTADEPLKPSEVCKTFAARMKPWGIKQFMCDGHNREAAREYLTAAGISIEDAPEGQGGKEQTYVDTRAKLKEGRIAIPKEPKRLLLQLGEVQSTQGLKGRLTIKSPLRPDGSHGDLASAFVLAVWKKWGVKVVENEKHVMPQAERDRLSELQRRLRTLQSGSLADLVSQACALPGGQAVPLSRGCSRDSLVERKRPASVRARRVQARAHVRRLVVA